MKPFLLFTLLLSLTSLCFSQSSDFIVLKKRNNRTLKTYYPGSFISAVTYNGFYINGYIREVRNDSLYIQQEESRLMGTDFGSVLDTLVYTIGIHFRDIERFHYSKKYGWNSKKGFAVITLPKILLIGGVGYILLEGINTAYRKESLNSRGKLITLGVAAGAALAGFIIPKIQKSRDKVGGKYKVLYVKMKQQF
jgi:hypothetical protein